MTILERDWSDGADAAELLLGEPMLPGWESEGEARATLELPPPLVLDPAGVGLLVLMVDGLANAENPPPVELAEANADGAAGLPNGLWPNEDCPNAEVAGGVPNAELVVPCTG